MTAIHKVLNESSHAKRIKTVHIDTSLQIERCKAAKKANVVEDALSQFGFKSSSTYAKLEFKRAWLQRLSYLYYASQNVNGLDELIGYINDQLSAHPLHRRRLSTCLQAVESFLSKIKEDLSPGAQLIRLQTHMRNAILGAYTWWDSSITHEYDGTKCVRAAEQPRQLAGGKVDVSIPQCRGSEIGCAIHQFFEKNREHFAAIKLAVAALGGRASKELQEAKQIIEYAEKDPNRLCDDRNCVKLGDTLIAIDGLAMDCFAANNDKEWVLLSEVLAKPLVNPVGEAKTAR